MDEAPTRSPDPDDVPGPSVRSLVDLVPRTLQSDPVEVAVRLREQHGHVVRIPAMYPGLGQPAYLVTHPDDVQYVLQTNPRSFRGLESPSTTDFGRVIRNSIVSLTEDSEEGSWTARLRQLSPEFSERTVEGHVPRLALVTLSTVAEYDAATTARANARPGGREGGWVRQLLGGDHDPARVHADSAGTVRLLPAMRRLSLRLLGVSVFGPDLRVHETEVIRAVARLRRLFKRRQFNLVTGAVSRRLSEELALPSFLPGHDLAPGLPAPGRGGIETLERVADEVVLRRERTPNVYGDALSAWLTRPDPVTGDPLDGETARMEVVGLLIAGFATLSAALTWSVYLAATHPWVQDRIRAEARRTPLFAPLDDVRAEGGVDDIDGPRVLADLEFTRRVWRETLRLYPTLPLFGRTARESVSLHGYDVEAGSTVLMSPYVTHRDPEFWADPETFDPDRFTPERRRERPEFAYYPFSGGPHACLGEALATTEAVTALAALFATHRVELAGGRTDVDTRDGPIPTGEGEESAGPGALDVGVDSGINLQPDREILVRFVPR